MPAAAAVPGLSALLAWPIEHLTEAADSWEALGARCYGVANQVWRDAVSADWQGHAAEALRSVTHADMLTASAVADELHEAAKVARSGASDLYAARSRIRYAVEDARTAGFDVGEDLSVTDCSSGGSSVQRAARQAQAQTFAGDIRQRAAQLVGLDQQVAGKITAAVAGIRNAFPQSPAVGTPPPTPAAPDYTPRIQEVDQHTFKQDPSLPQPGPPGNPFAGWTDEQMAQVATEIAHGHAWREHRGDFPGGWTERDLGRWIYDTMKDPSSRIATSIDSGGMALLRDGTIVYIDPRNSDYGTAFKPEPGPGSKWRTPLEYFEQQTRALEPLPPPTSGRLPPLAPGEMAPPASPAVAAQRSAPAQPPVEAPSVPKPAPLPEGGEGPMLPGGPVTPLGPHVIHPPHSIPHHWPILGEDDPGENPRDFE